MEYLMEFARNEPIGFLVFIFCVSLLFASLCLLVAQHYVLNPKLMKLRLKVSRHGYVETEVMPCGHYNIGCTHNNCNDG